MLVTRKASELDVVELTKDLPEHELKRGDRGTVVVTFETPDEAYDIEFVDETGTSRFARPILRTMQPDTIMRLPGKQYLVERRSIALQHKSGR
jgi:Domain of unknown function (DUF4926)